MSFHSKWFSLSYHKLQDYEMITNTIYYWLRLLKKNSYEHKKRKIVNTINVPT
jgi:hypothetical protein